MKRYFLLTIVVFAFLTGVFAQSPPTNAIYGANQQTPATFNTFVGYVSGNTTTTGTNNTFLGSYAGTTNGTGANNLFAGSLAGNVNNQGGFNVFLGYAAGFNNVSGTGNTFVGVGAGNATPNTPTWGNTSGNYNTYIGLYAGGAGNSGYQLFNATAIGYNAKVSVSNALVLGDTINSVKVGIGMTNPRFPLDVKGVVNMRVASNNPALKINNKDFLRIDKGGNFTVANFKLSYTSEDQWADKVFAPDTPLMDLTEVSNFINQHKHLPEIPSAQEVVENGVEVNVIISKMLKKIEELTLYTIQQEKEIQQLKDIVTQLKEHPTSKKN
jgi:hypothetical protein